MPQFVILLHTPATGSNQQSHFDFMLEDEDSNTLLTWRWDAIPTNSEPFTGTALSPHRIEYLIYEGEVSQNRGHVKRHEHGQYSGDVSAEANQWDIQLRGDLLQGHLKANRKSAEQWQFTYFRS